MSKETQYLGGMEQLKSENSSVFLGDVKISGDSVIGNNGKIIKKHSNKTELGIIVLIGLLSGIITIYSFFFK